MKEWNVFLSLFGLYFCLLLLNLCLAVGKTEKIKKKTKNKKQAFLFALDDICMIFPLLVKFCLFTGKTEMKKEETFTTTSSSLKSQSSGFCSYDTPEHKTSLEIYTIKRLETFFFLCVIFVCFPPFWLSFVCLPGKQRWKKKRKLLLLLLVWNSKVMHFVPVIQSKD